MYMYIHVCILKTKVRRFARVDDVCCRTCLKKNFKYEIIVIYTILQTKVVIINVLLSDDN